MAEAIDQSIVDVRECAVVLGLFTDM
jgi:hypothetical protein